MEYRGQIEIEGATFQFMLKEYVLCILNDQKIFFSNKMVNSLIDGDNCISLKDNNGNLLLTKIAECHSKTRYEWVFDVKAYIIKYNRCDEIQNQAIACKGLLLKSDVLDYFFRENNSYTKEALYLLNEWMGVEQRVEKPPHRKAFNIDIDGKRYDVQFKTIIQGNDNPFPFDIRNCMIVSGLGLSETKSIWKVFEIVSSFLKFISQSSHINFVNPIILYNGIDINETDTYLYVKPDTQTRIARERVLKYEDMESVLGELLMAIYEDDINFRSLFIADYDKITHADIMNVCAAFEIQFDKKHKEEFVYQEQRRVRRKMVKLLKNMKEEKFTEEEYPLFDEIIEGFNLYKDTLQKRIEKSLIEFVDIYGEDDIKADFELDFINMPKRIKDSRNALDHGNYQYKLESIMYWDSELLRAIVYMLILQMVGLKDGVKLKRLLKKLSRYA